MIMFMRQWITSFLLSVLVMTSVSAQVILTPEKKKEIEDLLIQANKGNASAQYWLGLKYFVLKDYSQSVYWYRKAADQGWSIAYSSLGECYEWGYGVEKDMGQAVFWYRKAASNGEVTSMYRLGRCYFEGLGVDKNYESAVFWFRRGADSGDPTAQRSLGDCYMKGLGVVQSKLNAQFLYAKSFLYFYQNLGNDLAIFQDAPERYMVGMHYENGLGVPLNLVEAYAYYASMAERSDDRSKAALVSLSKLLSEGEIAAGKKRAIELQKEIEAKRARNRSTK